MIENEHSIIIEQAPPTMGLRIFFFICSLPLFCVGLLGTYNIIDQLLINPRADLETINIVLGISLTVLFLVPPYSGLYVSMIPHKHLKLDKGLRQGLLTLSYPFFTKRKVFDFDDIKLPSIYFYEGIETESFSRWKLKFVLPDRTKIEDECYEIQPSTRQGNQEEIWRQQKWVLEDWRKHIQYVLLQ